jgi:xanthine dehydrogenase accessory factor
MEFFVAVRETRVLIKGAGDLASGVALRLHRAGFPVIMTEIAHPLMVRRTVSFGEAVFNGETIVEDVRARHALDVAAVPAIMAEGAIAVLVDPDAVSRHTIFPWVIVDAVMAKRNTGTAISDAPLVIGLGPGFTAGLDCHAVIETNRGHWPSGCCTHRPAAQCAP